MGISQPNSNIIQQLYEYAINEWRLFPVGMDKQPFTPHGFKDATQTQLGINEYLKKYPGCNWAGWFPRQFIIDIDVKHGNPGFENLARLESKHEKLPRTRTHKTPSTGNHYIYRQPKGYNIQKANPISNEYPGIDLQANDCYILLPPSRLENGGYTVIDPSPVIDAPIWLCDFALEAKRRLPIAAKPTAAGPIPMGQQQLWILSQIRSYQVKGSSEDATIRKTIIDIEDRCKDQDSRDPFTEEWVRKKVRYCYTNPLPDDPAHGRDSIIDWMKTSGRL